MTTQASSWNEDITRTEVNVNTDKVILENVLTFHIPKDLEIKDDLFSDISKDVHSFEQPPLTGPRLLLLHDWSLVHGYDSIRSWRAVAHCTVWSLCVVVFSPFFDDDLCFPKAVEDLNVEQFIS